MCPVVEAATMSDDGHQAGRGDHGHDHGHGDEHGHDHDHHAHDLDALGVAVVTVSSTRTLEEDVAGDAVAAAFEDDGHEVHAREVVADDYDAVQRAVDDAVDNAAVDAVLTVGGTGVTPDDVTVDAVEGLLDKQLPGFGELFRRRSHEEVGVRAIASRATAGVADGDVLFCLPGSENAARLGASIAVDVAPHLAGLARRDTA